MKGKIYIIGYAVGIGFAAATVLSAVGAVTAPYIEANQKAEKVRNIMKVLGVDYDAGAAPEALVERFEEEVQEKEGDVLTYYTYSPEDFPDDQQRIAVKFAGAGMWGPIEGFLALEPDMQTIAAVSIYEQEETPGLGGEIGADWFQKQFEGKSIVDEAGEKPGVRIVTEGKAEKLNEIDAITGATVTSDRLESMLNETIQGIQGERF